MNDDYEHDRTFEQAAREATRRFRSNMHNIIKNAELWFRCPQCGQSGLIDGEQAWGLVSIQCPTEGCTFHETGIVKPLMFGHEPLRRDQQFTLEPA